MKKILTISIAAYNVEKYIEETLDSILASKYKDEIDIVITNDGSKDKTLDIIKKYKETHPNIINFIDQKNAGAGSTVNNGIKNAKGKYFKMVDGDDWVVTENLDLLIEYLKLSDCDAILSNFEYYYEKDQKYKKGPSYDLDNKTIYKFDDVCNRLDVATSTVTYKTSILQDNNIKVSERFYSDYEFQVYPMPYITTISYYDIDVYVYRIGREGQSISIKGYQSHIADHQNVLFKLLSYYEQNKNKCSNNIKNYILKKISNFINVDLSVILSFKTCKENKNKIKKLLKQIEKDSFEIYDYSKKRNVMKYLINSQLCLYSILSFAKRIKNKC